MPDKDRAAQPTVLVPAQSSLKARSAGAPQAIQSLNQAYVTALQLAGICPVLLPTRGDLPGDLSWVGGLLLPGGLDVDPQRYGREPDPTTEPDRESDQLEFRLLKWALGQGVPVLAICRGLQVLNVGLGGTLVQDLPHHAPKGNPEDPGPRDREAHALRVERSSRLGRIVSAETLRVNSLHHQGIDQLAPGLVATAWAPDGLIEAVEIPDDRFVLGVQYHPEELAPHDPASRALFTAFAAACRAPAAARSRARAELVGLF